MKQTDFDIKVEPQCKGLCYDSAGGVKISECESILQSFCQTRPKLANMLILIHFGLAGTLILTDSFISVRTYVR